MAAARKGREDMLQYRQGKTGTSAIPAAKPSALPDANAGAGTVTIEGKQYKEGDIYTDKEGKTYKVRIKQ
jgi:hypothetical protein